MKGQNMNPIKFKKNRVRRTYKGGKLLDLWQGLPIGADCDRPEEWIASIVTAINVGKPPIPHEGLSRTTDGTFLKDLIHSAPEEMLGRTHTDFFGSSMGFLVKALDSFERLSIQVHPDKQTAKRLFNSNYGKTEAWHILETRKINGALPSIYAGFKPGITPELWRALFDQQDISAMLSQMNKIPVFPGETYLIRGGVPHAIGAGCLIIEIQEPTDYTIRTERHTASGEEIPDFMCHQGLGFDKMFDCFHYTAESLSCRLPQYTPYHYENAVVTPLITQTDTSAFFMEKWDINGSVSLPPPNSFSLWICIGGEGYIYGSDFCPLSIKKGESFFLPAACTDVALCGTKLCFLRCLPPCSTI